jgi:DNA modification methylase
MNNWHEGIPEEYRNQIVTGDARLLAERIPDNSVDLIFTDPVYERIEDYEWLAQTAARVLKPSSACLMWQGQQWLGATISSLNNSPLAYRWMLGWYASNNMQMVGKIGRNLAPLLWYEKGHSNPIHAVREIKESPIPSGDTPFKWAKRLDVVLYYLAKFTEPGAIVYDPFSGLGSLPAACKMLGRNFIASEIEQDRAQEARMRLLLTQPPLFTFSEEQTAMFEEATA